MLLLACSMRIGLGLLVALALVAGCDRPAEESKAPPVTESWNPPKDSTNVVLLCTSSAGGIGYKFEVRRAAIEKIPDWGPSSNTIPLLPQQAAQLALARYQSLHPSLTNLQAFSISLQPISWYSSKWAYYISLVPQDRTHPFLEPSNSLRTMVVLLDGTVVDPIIDADAKRRLRIDL